jgi:hypothetical protein
LTALGNFERLFSALSETITLNAIFKYTPFWEINQGLNKNGMRRISLYAVLKYKDHF